MLHLNVGEPGSATRGLETRDGHAIHYDESGVVIGLTLLNSLGSRGLAMQSVRAAVRAISAADVEFEAG